MVKGIPDVTKSKVRRDLLRLYISDPTARYYLRELERILGLPVANIRRELVNLEKAGLFTSERVANLVYYRVNQHSPVYGELKSLVDKTIGGVPSPLRGRLARLNELCAQYRVRRLVVFGSAVTGDFDPATSDLDFLVEFEPLSPAQHADHYFGLAEDLEGLFGRRVDLVEPGAIRNPYLKAAAEETGKVVCCAG